MFRKPKKIQRRVFCADDDEDGDPVPPPPPVISQDKRENKSIKTKTKKLLSFADEEEDDGEVFKVKKSSQSKRLAKRREKEKRQPIDGDNNRYDSNDNEDENLQLPINVEKPKKKVTLEGLILSGREALAADGVGDVSDDSPAHESEEETGGFHRYRPETVRAALAVAPGHIPDAALIHAARKTRQQARELGDFVPLNQNSEAPPGSRLMRDDGSGDDDDDDEEEGRVHVRGLELPSDKPKRGTAAAPIDEEVDSEAETWEQQQLQKARVAITDVAGDGLPELNPFCVAPPPPRLEAPYLRPLLSSGPVPTTAADLAAALQERLEELRVDREQTASKHEELRDRLLTAARVRESRAARKGHLDATYKRAQAARGFLTDLIECLDEKMPRIEALEARALALHRRRCEFLVERRRADIRDQAQDVLALTMRPGAVRQCDDEEKIRRTAEREGRRRARRLRREPLAAPHRDGDSSDDDLPPAEAAHFAAERESIASEAASLFSDALPAWRTIRGVVARLARWRARDPALYNDAYVADSLPKLLAPYVRHQLILWNPLADEDNEDFEKMDWYNCLMMYGVRSEKLSDSDESENGDTSPTFPSEVTEESVREDSDLWLVPTIIDKVVLPKITELIEHAWDPMCVRACVRVRRLLCTLVDVCSRAPLQRLATAAHERLAAALAADVFLPVVPPALHEGPAGVFWRRCVGAGVRLLRGSLALVAPPPALQADHLILALLDSLCRAAGLSGGQGAAAAAAALAESLPRSGPLRPLALGRLHALAKTALARIDTDNPLHLKALEQARSVIAESKAASAEYREP